MFLSMETALGFVSSPNKASVAKVPVSVSSTTMAVSETGSAKKTGPKGSNKKKASSSKKAAVPKGSNKKKANSSKKAAVPKKKQGGGSRKEKAKQFMVRRWASQQASKKKQAAPKQSEEFMSVVGLSTNDIKAERGKKKSPIRKTIKKRTTKEGNKQQEKGLLSWTDLKPGSKIPVTVIKLL